MLQEEVVPCQHCRVGMHRSCSTPAAIPTLMPYVKGGKAARSETITCCDRKEFWTVQSYD